MNAAISGSVLAVPEACFVRTKALPRGYTRGIATAHDIKVWPQAVKLCSSCFNTSIRPYYKTVV
jgi:hypothetical protein